MARDVSDYFRIATRHGRFGGVDVVGFKIAPNSSVLAGQTMTCFIDNFETEELALAAYPEAGGNRTSRLTQPTPSVSHLPGETDPVPGGMYPDDYTDRF